MKYHVDANGVLVSVEEQAQNESSKPLSGVTLRDADGNVRSLASVLLAKMACPFAKTSRRSFGSRVSLLADRWGGSPSFF